MILIPVSLCGQNKFVPPDPYTSWDGISHKSKYLITSPAFMGPNSLPVPWVHNARIPEHISMNGGFEYFKGTGNSTQDFFSQLVIPIADQRVALEFTYTPIEFYRMDSATSRLWRTYSGSPVTDESMGDFCFGTVIRIVRDHSWLPDLTVSMNFRTPSGTGRENARHTNTPGYYFDAAIGDEYATGYSFFRSVRWYAEGGFLVWQTYLDNYPQDDAILFGAGLNLDFRSFFINQTFRGYAGYMNNGDRPLVYRADLGIKVGTAAFMIGYEKGLKDYPFESIRCGFRIDEVFKHI
ncbi:MAG: hypothetical protein V2A67_09425 [Bacteroidota bacterium]